MGNFVSASPNEAAILSGRSGTRIFVGKTGFRFWIVEKVDRLSLELYTIHIKSHDAETCRGVRVNISSIAQVKVDAWKDIHEQPLDADGRSIHAKKGRSSAGDLNNTKIKLAAQHFLGGTNESIVDCLQRTLEGHQRQILGTLTVEELYKDRQAFSASVRDHVFDDLASMGFKLVSYTVNDISDNSDYMLSLGITQTAIVKREAAEGKARNESEAKKKVAEYTAQARIAEAHALREAHVVVAQQQEQEAEADRDLNLKKASFEREVNQARAEAEAAGPIESARQGQAVIREKTRQIEAEEKN
uniref:Band 7 domain-containing protein n=1 Tax=Aplanochytrium stocchinoi TaxID=215587 RepID=A0A7S3LRV4_9STRA